MTESQLASDKHNPRLTRSVLHNWARRYPRKLIFSATAAPESSEVSNPRDEENSSVVGKYLDIAVVLHRVGDRLGGIRQSDESDCSDDR